MAQRTDDARAIEATRADLTERSRDRILTAALEEFANRGFDGTTTAEIARRAGVTQPLVHYHFDSKEALWRAAIERALSGAVAAYGGVLAELADLEPIDQMKVLVRRFVHFSAANPELGRIISYEGVQGGPRLRWLIEHNVTGQFESFRTLYQRGVDEGWAKPLPFEHVVMSLGAAAAYLFIVKATMLELHGIEVDDPAVIEAHSDTVVELFFHGMLRPADGGSGADEASTDGVVTGDAVPRPVLGVAIGGGGDDA